MIIRNREDAARAIKSALAMRGETLTSYAAKQGLNRSSFSRSVNRSDISLSDLLRIADALGCQLKIEFSPRE